MGETGQNFDLWQGEDETIQIPITDGELPVNLTGASVTWVLTSGNTVVLTKTTDAGITLDSLDGTNDMIVISLDKADTTGLGAGYYAHECRVVSGGDEQVVCSGTVRLRRSSTAA